MGNQSGLVATEVQQGYADTWDVGGSRWPFYSADAFDPYAYVGTTTVVPMALLSAPPTYGQLDSSSAAYGGNAPQSAMLAASAPWSPKSSPLVMIILALVVGLYMFHYLYYKDRRKR